VARDDVFLETKVWISDYGYDATLHAFDKSAGKLGVDQLDLLLLHQPLPGRFDLTLDAYRGLEQLLAEGKVRAIAICSGFRCHLADACVARLRGFIGPRTGRTAPGGGCAAKMRPPQFRGLTA
jgi:diketogulonate reductase-like aldo/keto reductase